MSEDELEPVEADPVLPEAGEAVSAASVAAAETAAPSEREGQRLVSTQTVQHDYLTMNGKVARDTITVDGTVTTVMDFIYDESGRPVAVPEKIFGLTLILDFFDRCHSLASLAPPPAAVGSLPLCSEILRRRRQVRYNKLRKLKTDKKVDTASRSLVE